jgi:dihydroorotate dehydrogenase (fumarate)
MRMPAGIRMIIYKGRFRMADLRTNYLGLEIKSPLIASASALSKKLETIKQMEDTGLGAVVLYSLFEEEIIHESLALDHFLTRGTETFAEAITYFPELSAYNTGPENYLKLISRAKESVKIPIIGSLNGISTGGWIKYARMIEEAGADALELNMYFITTDPNLPAADLEAAQIQLISDIHKSIKIPLSVKLSPFYSSLPHFAARAVSAGAKGLVLFNRFYQPTLNIKDLEVVPALELSDSSDLLLPMRWIAILFDRVHADFALTSGVHTAEDMVKAIMAGSSVAMTASELVKNGIAQAKPMLEQFAQWMDDYGYKSVHQMLGVMSQKSVAEPAAFERANYMKALKLFDNRIMYTK